VAGPCAPDSAVRRRAALALVAGAALACAGSGTPSIPAGYTLAGSSNGVVIVRTELLTADGEPFTGGPLRATLRWHHEESGQDLELLAANDGPLADFWVSLPGGHYRMVATSGAGVRERWYVLRFRVEPGAVVYAGAVQVRAPDAADFTLEDEYDAAVARFRASHSELAGDVKKSLVQLLRCRPDAACEPQSWPGPG
jgi:hypothetical protein